jgi:hypothetical protein
MHIIDLEEKWVETPRAKTYAKKKYQVATFIPDMNSWHKELFDTKKAALDMIDATERRYKRQGYQYKVQK